MKELDKDFIDNLQLKAGTCYGCPAYPGGDFKLCDEFHNIKKMQKINSPCYNENVHVMNNVDAHDEYGNITKISF